MPRPERERQRELLGLRDQAREFFEFRLPLGHDPQEHVERIVQQHGLSESAEDRKNDIEARMRVGNDNVIKVWQKTYPDIDKREPNLKILLGRCESKLPKCYPHLSGLPGENIFAFCFWHLLGFGPKSTIAIMGISEERVKELHLTVVEALKPVVAAARRRGEMIK